MNVYGFVRKLFFPKPFLRSFIIKQITMNYIKKSSWLNQIVSKITNNKGEKGYG